jgi:hypothetical protein
LDTVSNQNSPSSQSAEIRAQERGIIFKRSRGKAYATVDIDGEDITFDGASADADAVVDDAIAYLDIHSSDGLFRVDYDEGADTHTVTLVGTGEVFTSASPAEAYAQAREAHEGYERQEAERQEEEARQRQEAEKAAKPARSRNRKPASDATTILPDGREVLQPTAAEHARQLGETGWDQPKPPANLPDEIIAGLRQIYAGLGQILEAAMAHKKE